jgi:hypothetical protein
MSLDLRLLITPLASAFFDYYVIHVSKFGLFIDGTSPICMKMRINILASVIIAQILLHTRKGYRMLHPVHIHLTIVNMAVIILLDDTNSDR